jgi:hypothetical protein
MKIINCNRGRLGNSIFRLLANIVFLIVYDIDEGEILYPYSNNNYHMEVNDEFFINWSNSILNGIIPSINKNLTLCFTGYYQHDKIFSYFKNDIIEYINKHPSLLLLTDRNDKYMANSLVNYRLEKKYKIVVHLRLEDFIEISHVINPNCIKNILFEIRNDYPDEEICFVLNKPNTELEIKYIEYLTKGISNIKTESNDVITDYTIMRDSSVLVCSCSTLSWSASFFSMSLEKVYMPNYNNPGRIHETFKKPITDTILYDFDKCSKEKLIEILN